MYKILLVRTELYFVYHVGNQLTNDISSFIDASMVYGSSEDELTALRARNGGEIIIKSIYRSLHSICVTK